MFLGALFEAYSHVPGSASHSVQEWGRRRGEHDRESQHKGRRRVMPSKFGGGGCASLKGGGDGGGRERSSPCGYVHSGL